MIRNVGALLLVLAGTAAPLAGQSFTTDDPVIRSIWREGMEHSQLERLAQPFMDSIGPRLTGTPNLTAGMAWRGRGKTKSKGRTEFDRRPASWLDALKFGKSHLAIRTEHDCF